MSGLNAAASEAPPEGASHEARSLAADALGLPADAIVSGSGIGTLDAWDSLGHMRLLMSLEAKLGRELTADEATGVMTIDDVARLLA